MMAFSKDQKLDQNSRGVLFDLINDSLGHLERDKEHLSEIIHEVRKNFKKIRALLRLLRYSLGKEIYKETNYFFRDLGRELSEARDADVTLETLDALCNHETISQQLDSEQVKILGEFLKDRRYHLQLYQVKTRGKLKNIYRELKEYKSDRHHWPVLKHDFATIGPGLKKIYEKGNKQFAKAYKTGEAKYFHEWRKEVKYLRYHLEMIEYLWPPILSVMEDEAHQLTDILGLEHDLNVLRQIIEKAVNEDKLSLNTETIFRAIDLYIRELREKARPLGSKLFADNPECFINRFRNFWKAVYQ